MNSAHFKTFRKNQRKLKLSQIFHNLKPAGENSKKAQKVLEKQKQEEKKALNKQKQKEIAQKKFSQKSNAIVKGNQNEFIDINEPVTSKELTVGEQVKYFTHII